MSMPHTINPLIVTTLWIAQFGLSSSLHVEFAPKAPVLYSGSESLSTARESEGAAALYVAPEETGRGVGCMVQDENCSNLCSAFAKNSNNGVPVRDMNFGTFTQGMGLYRFCDLRQRGSKHILIEGAPGGGPGTFSLFFHGTFNTPASYGSFLAYSASQGLNVLGLAWQYSEPVALVNAICSSTGETWDSVRRAMLSGVPECSIFPVERSNTVLSRLSALSSVLSAALSGSGFGAASSWKTHLDQVSGGDWSNVLLSGHSNGADMVSYLATTGGAMGVVMLAGPGLDQRVSPYFKNGLPATSYSSWGAVGHVSEIGIDMFRTNWRAMAGLESIEVSFDSLSKSDPPKLAYHESTGADWQCPLDKMKPYWNKLLNRARTAK